MVTTIGIDPHKATHTAVAIDESESVLGELTVLADRAQTRTLLEWAQRVDGDGRVWAVEAAGGLGYLLSQQLVASGERVVDVPPVLAYRVRVLGSGRSDRTTPTMPCRWRSPLYASRVWRWSDGRTTPRF
jgi:transposase